MSCFCLLCGNSPHRNQCEDDTLKVLLTGAMGNIGFSTLEALLVEGHDVVAFDLESRRARQLASGFDGRVQFVWGDITDPESLRHALEGVDAVIHLAAIIPPSTDRAPDVARKVNLDATRSLIAQMEASPTANRLVFASSSRHLRRRPGSRAAAARRHARLLRPTSTGATRWRASKRSGSRGCGGASCGLRL